MDGFGKVYCAPPGGTAVETLTGVVVCSPGNCETDYSGYLKCSRELNGGAIKDAFGKVVCVGGCVNPIIDYCVVPK